MQCTCQVDTKDVFTCRFALPVDANYVLVDFTVKLVLEQQTAYSMGYNAKLLDNTQDRFNTDLQSPRLCIMV